MTSEYPLISSQGFYVFDTRFQGSNRLKQEVGCLPSLGYNIIIWCRHPSPWIHTSPKAGRGYDFQQPHLITLSHNTNKWTQVRMVFKDKAITHGHGRNNTLQHGCALLFCQYLTGRRCHSPVIVNHNKDNHNVTSSSTSFSKDSYDCIASSYVYIRFLCLSSPTLNFG